MTTDSGGTFDVQSAPKAKSFGEHRFVRSVFGISSFHGDAGRETAWCSTVGREVRVRPAIENHKRVDHGFGTYRDVWGNRVPKSLGTCFRTRRAEGHDSRIRSITARFRWQLWL